MIGPVPKLGIELSKKAARRGLPRPPKIETQLAQRLERRRQSRSHVVSLKSRHANVAGQQRRELIKKTSSGKFSWTGGPVSLCRGYPPPGKSRSRRQVAAQEQARQRIRRLIRRHAPPC